ncbi:MAG: hypothetical protein ACTSQU_17740 [Promethearchaeota archaeon]
MSIRKETTVDPLNAQFSKTDNVEILNSERVNSSVWLERKSFRISLIATFTALAIVLGYAMAYIPNIEVFTLMIFLSGFIMSYNWIIERIHFYILQPIWAFSAPTFYLSTDTLFFNRNIWWFDKEFYAE